MQLAGIVKVNYTDSFDMNTNLTRLQTIGDGHVDTVHTMRNDYAADVVVLFLGRVPLMGVSNTFAVADMAFSVMHIKGVFWIISGTTE